MGRGGEGSVRSPTDHLSPSYWHILCDCLLTIFSLFCVPIFLSKDYITWVVSFSLSDHHWSEICLFFSLIGNIFISDHDRFSFSVTTESSIFLSLSDHYWPEFVSLSLPRSKLIRIYLFLSLITSSNHLTLSLSLLSLSFSLTATQWSEFFSSSPITNDQNFLTLSDLFDRSEFLSLSHRSKLFSNYWSDQLVFCCPALLSITGGDQSQIASGYHHQQFAPLFFVVLVL